MVRWELWEDPDDAHAFFPSTNDEARRLAEAEGARCTWSVEAAAPNPAMRALYEHLGYGDYHPMLRPDGTPYPEDELGPDVGA